MLDLTRIIRNKTELRLEVVDVHAALRSAIAMFQQEIDAKKLDITIGLSAARHHVWADPDRLRQILTNLLSNAVKFTPAGGEVDVTMQPDGGDVLITVRDTGIGIAPEHLESVFEAFHQGDPRVSRRFEGTGLGLSITKRLVEQHDGKIWIESELGSGTRVTVRLPRRPAKPEQQAAPKPARAPKTQRPSKARATVTTR